VQESIASWSDVVFFSGDKLIGGPQSGIIVGRSQYIEQIRKHPLARALRVGKFTVAALEATLKLFLDPETLLEKNPVLRMLTTPYELLEERAAALAQRLSEHIECEAISGESACGGGALPTTTLRTAVVSLHHGDLSAQEFARRLRLSDPPIITRVQDDAVQIDVRTLLEGDEGRIEAAIRQVHG
jgi:L-seryl-tRNA(Ser) seleniumtransferase